MADERALVQVPNTFEPAMEDAILQPTKAMREAKAKFWQAWAEHPHCAPDEVTLAAVVQELNDSRIHRWWGIPQFKLWFLNKETFVHKVLANGERAAEVVQEILDDPNLPPSLKLKAAQIAIDQRNKVAAQSTIEKYADKEIDSADKEELLKILEKYTK